MNSPRIRVKMCGMTRAEDVAHAVNLGVDAIGLIFYAKSKRCISIEKAKEVLKDLPPFVTAVAVLVNADKNFVQQLVEELPIQLLQFHGDESAEFCQQFNKPFIKAIQPVTSDQINHTMNTFKKASAILLDTPSTSSRGGTGLVFDWKIIPQHVSMPYILAGGLNEVNVFHAVKTCSPYAVDVCSGIEASPGIKDHAKMTRFIEALRGK